MGRDYRNFLADKQLRDEYITIVAGFLNNILKELNINKQYTTEDLINNANDKKRQENYIKANEKVNEIEEKQKYFGKLCEKHNIVFENGYNRALNYMIKLPSSDVNKEEIEKQNLELIKNYLGTGNDIKEKVKNDLNHFFEMDKSIFYVDTVDEAFEILENHEEDIAKIFTVDTIYKNSYLVPNEEIKDQFKYYLTTLEDGEIPLTKIQQYSTALSLFLPDDLDYEVVNLLNIKIMSDIDNQKYSSIIDKNAESVYYIGRAVVLQKDVEVKKAMKKFLKEQPNDFMKHHTIGGKTFKEQFEEDFKYNEPHKIKDAKKSFYYGLEIPDDSTFSHILKDTADKNVDILKEIKSGNDSIANHTYSIFDKKVLQETDKSTLAYYYSYAKYRDPRKHDSIEFVAAVDKLIENNKLDAKEFDSYVEVYHKNIDPRSIHSIDKNGITYANEFKSEHEDPNLEFASKLANMHYQCLLLGNEALDNHFDQYNVDKIFNRSEMRIKVDFYTEYAIKTLGLKKDSSLFDVFNALHTSDIKLEKGIFEKLELEASRYKEATDDLDNFEKLQKDNPDKDLSNIKHALRGMKDRFSEHFKEAENIYENATYLYLGKDPVLEYIDENPQLNGKIKLGVNLCEYEPDKHEETNKSISKNNLSLSNKTKENIKTVVQKMKDLKIFDPNNIDPTLREAGEQPYKIYGFQKLNTKRDELKNAIKNGNVEEANKKAQEFETIIGEYQELFEFVEKTLPQDGKHNPGNVACLRNGRIPFDVQKYVSAQMQVNGLYNMLVNLDKEKIELDDFLDNPQILFNKVAQEKLDDITNRYGKTQYNEEEELNDELAGQSLANLLQLPVTSMDVATGRSFEAILDLETDEKLIKENAIAYMYNSGLLSTTIDEIDIFTKKDPNSANRYSFDYTKIKEYMALGDKYPITSFMNNYTNPYTGEKFEKTYNYDSFVKIDPRPLEDIYKSTLNKLTIALNELNTKATKNENGELELELNEKTTLSNFVAGAMCYFNDVLKEKNVDLSQDKGGLMMKNLIDNPLETIYKEMESKFNRKYNKDTLYTDYYSGLKNIMDDIEALNNEGRLDYAYQLGNSRTSINTKLDEYKDTTTFSMTDKFDSIKTQPFAENGSDLLTMAYTLNDRNSKRSIWGQIFRPSAWKERRVLSEIRDIIKNNHVDEESYDRMLNINDTNQTRMFINFKCASLMNTSAIKAIEASEEPIPDIVERVDEKQIEQDLNKSFIEEKDLEELEEIEEKIVSDNLGIISEDKGKQIQIPDNDVETNQDLNKSFAEEKSLEQIEAEYEEAEAELFNMN